jgi:hypothetical protein
MESFRVEPYYKCTDIIGEGAYGVVVYVLPLDRLVCRFFLHPADNKRYLLSQLRRSHPFKHPRRNQANHSVRPFHVLYADVEGDQAVTALSVRCAYLVTRCTLRLEVDVGLWNAKLEQS